jgi:hypothetical protein
VGKVPWRREGTRTPAVAPSHHKSGANSTEKAGTKCRYFTVSFADAELAGLAIKTAKNGNKYVASGVLILRNENGGFQSSLPFICFS